MSQTLHTTLDTYYDDIEDFFPIERHDKLVGVHDNHKFRVTYDPPKNTEETSFRGDFCIDIFAHRDNPNGERGGAILYTERHTEPDGYHELRPLFSRARKIAVKLAANDKYHECQYCGALANDEWKIERSLSLFSGKGLRRAIPINNRKHTDYCAGLSSWLLPKVEVYEHRKDENPLFSQRELNNCKTLKMATGYPEWQYKTQLYPYTYQELQSLLEEHPEVFDDELDRETMQRMLDYLSYDSDRPNERLIDRGNMTRHNSR